MIEIIYPPYFLGKWRLKNLQKKVYYATQLLKLQDKKVTLTLCNDIKMQKLNNQYRHIDKTTDVLSFNLDFIDPQLM